MKNLSVVYVQGKGKQEEEEEEEVDESNSLRHKNQLLLFTLSLSHKSRATPAYYSLQEITETDSQRVKKKAGIHSKVERPAVFIVWRGSHTIAKWTDGRMDGVNACV